MNKWEELATTATLENFLTNLLHKSKKLVFKSRIDKKELTKEVFEQKIERLAKVYRASIMSKFFKKNVDYQKDA